MVHSLHPATPKAGRNNAAARARKPRPPNPPQGRATPRSRPPNVITFLDPAPLAQLDRATVFGTVGWGFDSLRVRFLVILPVGNLLKSGDKSCKHRALRCCRIFRWSDALLFVSAGCSRLRRCFLRRRLGLAARCQGSLPHREGDVLLANLKVMVHRHCF